MSQSKSRSKKNWATLPLSRVNTIMRSSPEVSSVSPDAIALTAKAAELFIAQLAKDAFKENKDKTKLDYNDISSIVFSHPRMAFLQDIVPKKIKAKEYFQILRQIEAKEKSEQLNTTNESESESEDNADESSDEENGDEEDESDEEDANEENEDDDNEEEEDEEEDEEMDNDESDE